jgi:RNA polymerase sigma factor (sigma-70 family)
MNPSDADLLKSYAQQKSDAAFAELVGRYVNLVHASAMRQLRDAHWADDVTQAVFIVLARRAGHVRGEYLAGWLLKTTRYCAADALKRQARRVLHEQQAAAMKETVTHPTDSSQAEIAEFLDGALADLKPRESTAIAMRFLQNKSPADVAVGMGISQDAVQKVIARALPKLRRILVGRGLVLSGTTGLTEFMLVASHHTAPTSFSLANSATGFAIAKGAMRIMVWGKLTAAAVIAASVMAITGGVGIGLSHRAGMATAAIPATIPLALAPAERVPVTTRVQPFQSPFLELRGCRIIEPVKATMRLSPGTASSTMKFFANEDLAVDCNVTPEVSEKTDRIVETIVSSEDGAVLSQTTRIYRRGKNRIEADSIWFGADGKMAGIGLRFLHVAPEPGDYLIRLEAMDATKNVLAKIVIPLHVDALPSTEIEITDILPDGNALVTTIAQALNTTTQPFQGGQFMVLDYSQVHTMTDAQGTPISFTTQHHKNLFLHLYKLPSPVPPGEAIMFSFSTTRTGTDLVERLPDGTFECSVSQMLMGGKDPMQRIKLFRLPVGATLISTEPGDLPHREFGGRTQIFMEKVVPGNLGQIALSFRYRLPR